MRNSGKTYRAMLRALASASSGENVIFVSNTEPHAERAKRMMHYLTALLERTDHRQDKVIFPNHGWVWVMTLARYRWREEGGMNVGMHMIQKVFDT